MANTLLNTEDSIESSKFADSDCSTTLDRRAENQFGHRNGDTAKSVWEGKTESGETNVSKLKRKPGMQKKGQEQILEN